MIDLDKLRVTAHRSYNLGMPAGPVRRTRRQREEAGEEIFGEGSMRPLVFIVHPVRCDQWVERVFDRWIVGKVRLRDAIDVANSEIDVGHSPLDRKRDEESEGGEDGAEDSDE